MKRIASKTANSRAKDKSKAIPKLETLDDLTLDDLDHLISGKCYDSKHVAGVAKCLFEKYRIGNFEEQFGVVGSLTQLEIFLETFKTDKVGKKTIYILYRTNASHWITICFVHAKNGVVMLYKDSLGGNVPPEIREIVEKHCSDITIKAHVGIEQEDGNSGGPMALKNMARIVESIQEMMMNDIRSLIFDFENISFCTSAEVQMVKSDFMFNVGGTIAKKCIYLAREISENKEFKEEVVKLVDSCVNCIDLIADIESCAKSMRDFESEILAKNPEHISTVDDLQAKQEKIMNHPQVKLWAQQSAQNNGNILNSQVKKDNNEPDSSKTELEKKFPNETKKFTLAFKLLGGVVTTSFHAEREDALREVSDILGIDSTKIDLLYQTLSDKPQVATSQESKKVDIVRPVGIGEISRQISVLTSKNASKVDTKVKPVEQILAELALEQDISLPSESYFDNNQIEKLERRYREVKKYYEAIKTDGYQEITDWARANKDSVNPCEAIAVMNRANELITGGNLLRDTQILSVLAFLASDSSQGKLCQIATGEGKTVIVSLLAAIKVLQGKQVDVITSNGVLADEGVNNRKHFFGLFGISVAHNNPDESHTQGPRKCYTADVVYGSMGSFQFDYLKDSFEGLETRGKRRFDFVILDEVDSLLLDDGGHIAKLAEQFPGFDSFKYVYIKIWQELVKAENELARECEKAINRTAIELERKKNTISEQEFQKEFEKQHCNVNIFNNQEEKLVSKIKKSDPSNIDLIPCHLKQFAKDMVDVWIKNAVYAKYSCHENEQYVVRKLQTGDEPKIVPVDYQSTGVTLKNTMWSNGLHQFVQLKHNLQLTSESLTSSLISNIGYVKMYKSNIFGLTGTLGSTAEQELLSSVYNVGYSKIPTFKPKKFKEMGGKIIKDDGFKEDIVRDSLKLINDKRSVLIICNTISDALGLNKKLQNKNQEGLLKISTYFDEDSSAILGEVIGVGEIIIATNIAGRGSDFKTSLELEENGGLHVCVCFLPVNQRVEDQAFGRTARQGKAGSAQIVMRESDALALGFAAEGQDLEFKAIKERRDQLEASRLDKIRKVQLADIDFCDTIFSQFSKLYRRISVLEKDQPSLYYLLKDLKEFWAFWLHRKQRAEDKKDKDNCEKTHRDVGEEFKSFEAEASAILGKIKDGEYVGGSISHNPYYSIQQAEHYIQNNLLDFATESLNHAIKLSGSNSEVLYTAYVKKFEVSVEQGQSIIRTFFALINRVLPFDFNAKSDRKDNYKKEAKDALELAKKGIENEIIYIKRNFTSAPSNLKKTKETGNKDFLKILATGSNNVFVNHVRSKLTVLYTYLKHVESLLAVIDKSVVQKCDIALSSKISNYWNSKNLTPDQVELRKFIGDDELQEISMKGLGTMYAIKIESPNLNIGFLNPGIAQVSIGASALATGFAFAPSMPVMKQIADAFINEGMSDILVVIVTQEESTFNIKSKLNTYGRQALTVGAFSIIGYTQLAQRIIQGCQSLIAYLEKCPELEDVCKLLVPLIGKIVSVLEKAIAEHGVQELGTVGSGWMSKGFGAVKDGVSSQIKNVIDGKGVDAFIDHLQPAIVEYVTNTVKSTIKIKRFKHESKECVLEQVTSVLEATPNDILKDGARMFLEKINSWVKSSDFPNAFRVKSSSYTEEVCKTLSKKLKVISDKKSENNNEEVDAILNEVSNKIAMHVIDQFKKQVKKLVSTAMVFGKQSMLMYSLISHVG